MATTAQITDFETSGHKEGGFFVHLGKKFMLAAEARAILRIEQEAGHMLTEEQVERMKRDFAQRCQRLLG